jgi:uroporphyrinogen decarboxylase
MNSRERFSAIARFERKNDPMWFNFDAWYQAFIRWHEEGMPVTDMHTKKEILMHFLGYGNQYECLIPNAAIKGIGPLNNPPWVPPLDPPFEEEILEEDERTVTKIIYEGTKVKLRKDVPESMPQYLDYPVRDRKSWNAYKKRLDPYSKGRFPEGWDIMTDKTVTNWPLKRELEGKSFNERDFLLIQMCASLFGMPRDYMGIENISYALHDDPTFVQDMMEYQMYYSMEVLKQIFKKGILFDVAFIWEDMAYRSGSLISPKIVKEWMVPRYKKITNLLRENGVNFILVDCDGNVEELLPLWLEGGINGIFPLEVAAGMDPVKLRKRYGKNLFLTGGIDKRELAKGKPEIDRQVEIVKGLIEDGGYFVQGDHHLPENISYENIVYFVNEVNKLGEYEEFRRTI